MIQFLLTYLVGEKRGVKMKRRGRDGRERERRRGEGRRGRNEERKEL